MMTPRPNVDVVMPFAGTGESLLEAVQQLERLETRSGDTLVLVDNRAPGAGSAARRLARPDLTVVQAPDVQSSYYARNCGAKHGKNPWVLFLDSDVEVSKGLIDAYFKVTPGARVAILAGGISDEPSQTGVEAAPAVRYAYLRRFLDQRGTMERSEWTYAKTANCAIRRQALEEAGWFREDLRSGGDAEICFRLQAAGWELAFSEEARVLHRSRTTVWQFLRQVAKHGSGSQWLEERYPGFSPRGRWLGLIWWTLRCVLRGTYSAVRGDRDAMLISYLGVARSWAFRIGRYHSNVVADGRRFRLPQEGARHKGGLA